MVLCECVGACRERRSDVVCCVEQLPGACDSACVRCAAIRSDDFCDVRLTCKLHASCEVQRVLVDSLYVERASSGSRALPCRLGYVVLRLGVAGRTVSALHTRFEIGDPHVPTCTVAIAVVLARCALYTDWLILEVRHTVDELVRQLTCGEQWFVVKADCNRSLCLGHITWPVGRCGRLCVCHDLFGTEYSRIECEDRRNESDEALWALTDALSGEHIECTLFVDVEAGLAHITDGLAGALSTVGAARLTHSGWLTEEEAVFAYLAVEEATAWANGARTDSIRVNHARLKI